MASAKPRLLYQLESVLGAGRRGMLPDQELLERFVTQHDQAAFSVLVSRHGRLVLNVCRRVLHNAEDAEDAFQATFLVLAQKAGAVGKREALASWLYRVAYRVALRARASALRRQQKEGNISAKSGEDPFSAITARELLNVLDAELNALPAASRGPLVLCCLAEQRQDEAARQLGVSVRTLRRRLEEGRAQLRRRLERRGMGMAAALLVVDCLPGTARAAVPGLLMRSTVNAVMQAGAGRTLAGAVSAKAALLANGILRAMAVGKALTIGGLFGLLTVVILGIGVAVQPESTASGELQAQATARSGQGVDPAKAAKPPKTLAEDEPLPPNALARLGTLRLRHGNPIRVLNFSPDSKTLLSADWHGVHFWNAETGKHLRRFGDPRGRQFQDIAVTRDNRFVALSMSEGDLEIWDAATGQKLRQFQVGGRFPCMVWSPDATLLAVCDLVPRGDKEVRRLRLLDALTGSERHHLRGHQDEIHSFLFSRDGKSLVTSSEDKTVRFWDTATGKEVRRIDLRTPVDRIELSPDGNTLVTVPTEKRVSSQANGLTITTWMPVGEPDLWDLASGKKRHHLAKPDPKIEGKDPSWVNGLFFTPDSKLLAVSYARTHWYDVATGKEVIADRLPPCRATTLAFSPDGKTFASSWYPSIQLWDRATGKQKKVGGGHEESIRAVAISPDGRALATAGGDRTIRLWDASRGEEKRRLSLPDGWVVDFLAFGRDGCTLVADLQPIFPGPGSDPVVRIWELPTGKPIRTFPGSRAALSPDGNLLAAEGQDKCARVWELASGRELQSWSSAGNRASAFSPDGQNIWSYEEDKKVHLRDIATGRQLRQFEGHHYRRDSMDRIYGVAFSPDGKRVAFGGQDREIAVYDLQTGKQARLLETPESAIYALAFSPDSRLLASSGGAWGGATLYLWEIATGQQVQQFNGNRGGVNCMAFSPSGKRLLTGSVDTTALWWDVTGQEGQSPRGPLTDRDLNLCWADLTGRDASRAFVARWKLASSAEETLPYLQERLRPIRQPEKQEMDRLLGDLGSPQFSVRAKAQAELEKLAEAAEPELRQALRDNPPLELMQRVQKLLDRLHNPVAPPDILGQLRAFAVLEDIGSPAARKLLASVASGAPAARLTREARASLDRLDKRVASGPIGGS